MKPKPFKPTWEEGYPFVSCENCQRDYDRKTAIRCKGSCRGFKVACKDFKPIPADKLHEEAPHE